jgi:predicted Fe-Mo cluster-binding NifX family protein
MKIAIATDGGFVSSHFGRCQSYTMVDIQNGKVLAKDLLMNPGHAPGAIPEFLHSKGADKIVCGGIGSRATELFAQYGIEIVAGVEATVDQVIEQLLKGTLISKESLCVPGKGRGIGVEKTECDHVNEA